MYSSKKCTALALVLAQLLAVIHGVVYDETDHWVESDKTKNFPNNAVLGGYDPLGYDNYVGRAYYSSSVLPARVRAETGYTTGNNDLNNYTASYYDVLVANETLSYDWIRSFDGFMEKSMVSVGTSSGNERVYVCRARSDGGIIIGSLYLSQRTCIIRYEGLALKMISKYEVLVRKHKLASFKPFTNQIN